MDFKIDTKSTFTTIVPIAAEISAKMTGLLREQCQQLTENGSKNFIVDLQGANYIEKKAIAELIELHQWMYGNQQSLVLTGIGEQMMAVLKESEVHLMMNIAPSMIEAIDIVSMEMLERDLLSEE